MIKVNEFTGKPLAPLDKCIPAVGPSSKPWSILGVPFQQAYYTWHIVRSDEGGEPWLGEI